MLAIKSLLYLATALLSRIPLLMNRGRRAVALSFFLFALPAFGQVQRMAIPAGVYRIGAPRTGANTPGSTLLRSFCIDPHFAAPSGESVYNSIVSGAGNATVKFPDGQTMQLKAALASGKVRISGTEESINHLELSGPPGTEVHVNTPMALSADPWLENSKNYRFEPQVLSHFNSLQKRNLDTVTTQLGTWARIQFGQIFGEDGVKLFDEIANSRQVEGVTVSRAGMEPAVWARTVGPKELDVRTEIIRRDAGRLVRTVLDSTELSRQRANIAKRLESLATEHTSFMVMMPEGDPFFVTRGVQEARVLDFDADKLEPVEQWLTSKPTGQKPNLIVVSDASPLEHEFGMWDLRRRYGDRLRIYEDDDPVRAAANVQAQRPIRAGADLALYSDNTVKTAGILSGLEPAFTRAGVRIVNSGIVQAGNVIVVTGHKDAAFRSYLAGLAANGTLKGKTVALLSCAATGDREFARFLLNEGGATCVLRINQEINSAAAREVLIQIAKQFTSLPSDGKHLDELIDDATKAAAQEAASEDFIQELRAILDHSLQVSMAD